MKSVPETPGQVRKGALRQDALRTPDGSKGGKVLSIREQGAVKDIGDCGFTFIDLFAGIGGLRRGFEKVGGRCVYTSEWDTHALQTYRENYGEAHYIEEKDIALADQSLIPAHDVLLAGFPCQPFSLAGVSKKNALGRPHGFADPTQGTLFFQIKKILESHQPAAFLLENVANLRRHDQGRTWEVIRSTLLDLEYDIHEQVVNAKRVLPQNRERIYIVGFRNPTPFNWSALGLPEESEGPKLRDVLHRGDESDVDLRYTDTSGRVLEKYTLSDHLWRYLREYADKHRLKGNGFGFGLFGPDDVARTLSARYHKDGSEILIRQEGRNPRRLTPRECARLMGFDPLLSTGKPAEIDFRIPVSDTQAYRQFGNSVAVPVVEAIARLMRPHIEAAVADRNGGSPASIVAAG